MILYRCLGGVTVYKICLYLSIIRFIALILDEVNTVVQAVEGDRLNIKCDYSEANKISKVQWTKESDDETPFDSPSILSNKLQWYVLFCNNNLPELLLRNKLIIGLLSTLLP